MKKFGILVALTLTSTFASANSTCDINLSDEKGDVIKIVSAEAKVMDEACNVATQKCEEMALMDFEGDERLFCDATSNDEKIDRRRCTVRLTGPIGRFTIRRYTAFGFRACRRALRRCERSSYRYRGFNRCIIEYRDYRRGRRGDRYRRGGRGGRRG